MKAQPNRSTRIREVRKARGYTLKELAEKIKTTPQTVQRLETATMTVSITWLEKIAVALEVATYELLASCSAQTTPDGIFLKTLGDAVIHNRRHIPAFEDVLPSLLESLGRLSGLTLEYRKGLRPWDVVYEQALSVAAAAMRIGVDG